MDANPAASCKFNLLYKNTDQLSKKQQQRRNELLSNRLYKRDKLVSSIRKLVSDVVDVDEDSQQQQQHQQQNEVVSMNIASNQQNATSQMHMATPAAAPGLSPFIGTTSHSPGASPCSSSSSNKSTSVQIEDRKFRNKAMLSEWLLDRPMDFESEWVLKATPVGRRCLVFARKGHTVAYSRTGQFIRKFQSSLPGGCHVPPSYCRRQFAIVDCIYVQQTNTFYIMDCLAWNEQKVYESEASFRFFWLKSKYNENQEKFLTISSQNECKFYCLNTYSASDQDILTALESDPLIKEHNIQLDGLLFFHIRGPYVPGSNPLVLWIKPDMVNRVLSSSSSSNNNNNSNNINMN